MYDSGNKIGVRELLDGWHLYYTIHSLLHSTTVYYGMYRLTPIMSPEIGVRRSKECIVQ
jgi:hypothetical protein